MVKSRFSKMRVAGFTVVVPDNPRAIEEDLALFDHDPAKLARSKKVIGFGTRYLGVEGLTGTDLCVAAARRLINGLNLDVGDLDALICAIQKPDYIQPGPSFLAHRDLGLSKNCAVFDLNHGCSGFLYGLWLAGGLLEGGAARKIMLLAGEHFSYTPGQRDSLLFCDAGSATLVEYDPQAPPSWFNIQADRSEERRVGKECQ
jgi:3-oxoacyl-[acyl-carrier-protein] synthase-3